MKEKITQNDIIKLLDSLYEKSINGIPIVSKPVDVLANEYLHKKKDTRKAAKSFINYQVAKCTTSGDEYLMFSECIDCKYDKGEDYVKIG